MFQTLVIRIQIPMGSEVFERLQVSLMTLKVPGLPRSSSVDLLSQSGLDTAIILKRANRDELFHGNFVLHHRKKQLHTSCYYGPLVIPFRIGQIGRDNRR